MTQNNAPPPARLEILPEGFHGDTHLQEVVDSILLHSDLFVETGTNVGSTLRYTAQRFPSLRCLSCEPDPVAFAIASNNTSGLTNVGIANTTSENFLKDVLLKENPPRGKVLAFWLDAHCYGFGWPLREELSLIADSGFTAWVFIDDCEVPGQPGFAFHSDRHERCTLAFVREAAASAPNARFWGPAYTEHTSMFHPLTGWCLISIAARDYDDAALLRPLQPHLILEYR